MHVCCGACCLPICCKLDIIYTNFYLINAPVTYQTCFCYLIGLKSRTDDAFLLRFLRARKFDHDRAYNMLVNYYTIRANNADIFGHITPSTVEHVYDYGVAAVLPHKDQQGRRIVYLRPGACENCLLYSLIECHDF